LAQPFVCHHLADDASWCAAALAATRAAIAWAREYPRD
jgi:hypothetical protein